MLTLVQLFDREGENVVMWTHQPLAPPAHLWFLNIPQTKQLTATSHTQANVMLLKTTPAPFAAGISTEVLNYSEWETCYIYVEAEETQKSGS